MRRILAVMLGVVALATLFYGCGKASSPAEKLDERERAGQAETTTLEPTARPAPPAAPLAACPARSKRHSLRRTVG